MSKNSKTFFLVVALVVLVSGGLIFMASRSSKDKNDTSQNEKIEGDVAGASTEGNNYSAQYIENLAKTLTEKGMVMYGAYWCHHCQDQKKAFGDAVKYIDFVECDSKGQNANPDECVAQGIESYPTWVYQGKKYTGYKTLSELAQIVGFTENK